MMDEMRAALIADIEATAKALNLEPSTIGKRIGQGGEFYKRLTEGRRFWPDTAEKVARQLAEMRARAEDAA